MRFVNAFSKGVLMRITCRTAVLSGLIVLSATALRAQAPVDLSGHWEGSIQAPGMELGFQIDLAGSAGRELSGTVSIPSENLRGVPLQMVSIKDKVVSFYARRDQPLAGYLSDDGRSISGDYSIEGFTLPFNLTRTGDARIEPPVRSAAVSRELEGTWTGSLQAGGESLRVSLTMANLPDGTATGRLVVIDQGGLQIPVAIVQQASSVTLDSNAVPARFSGALTAEGAELAGTWTQGSIEVPLTFRRATGSGK
jgi:hypothetical protein